MRFLMCFSAFFQFWLVGKEKHIYLIQFSSVAQLCPALCDPTDCSTPDFFVHHQFPELAQIHVHRVGDANQPSHPLLSLSPHAFNLPQHQDLFQGVSSSYQVVKVLKLQLQYQSFQWLFKYWFHLGLTGLISFSSRDSQESSPTLQFKSTNSSVLSFLYHPTLTFIYLSWNGFLKAGDSTVKKLSHGV